MTVVVCFHLYAAPRLVKFIETERRRVVARGWEEGGMGVIVFFFFAVPCSMQDLGFPTGSQTCAPCTGSEESTSLDCQGLFKVEAGRVSF